MPNRDGRFHSLVDETEDDPVTRLDINIDRIASSPAVIRGEHAHTLNSSFTMNGPSYLCDACETDDNLEEVNYATQVAEMNAREQEDPVTPSVIVQDIIHQQASVDMMRKASAAELRKASATEMSIVHRHHTSAVHPPPSTPPPTITVPATSASISSSSPQPTDSCLTNENTLSLASSTADPHECHHPPFYQRQHSLRASPASSIRRYDSEMENGWSVQFDIGTFIEEYFVHLFGPLSYPYLAYRYSRAFAANHDLCDPFGRGRGGFWAYCMFVMMNCLFYFYGGSNVVTSSEIVIANAVFLARNCIVACKYAYLSPIQMSTRMKRYLTQDEIGNQLLISGWRKIPYQVQVEEIDHAFCRLGFPESEKSFATFIGHTRQTMIEGLQQNVPDSFIPEDRPDWKSARDKGRLHLRLICQRFVYDAVEAVQYRHMIPVVIIAALIHGTIPCIVRAAQGHSPFGNTWYQVCMIVMSFTISAPNFSANLLFVLVGLIDYRRRIFVMHRCSSLLVDDCPLTGDDTKATMPLLNFTRANNVGVWLELRQVLKDFGKQFFHRVQAYASFWVFTVVCMLGFLFFQLLFQSYAEPTGIILISFDLLTVGVTLFFMLGSAKKLNMIHVDHRKILLQKLSDMQRHISLLTGTDSCAVKYAESVMSAKKMIKVAIQVIETDDELSPVKILGFNANDNLVRALVTAAGSGLIAAGKILADKYRS